MVDKVAGMTLEDFIQLYEAEGPFELIDGEVIKLHPTVNKHTLTIKRLYFALFDYETDQQIGEVFSEAPFVLHDVPNWVEGSRVPDIMFFHAAGLAAFRLQFPDWEDKPFLLVPDLVVEVMSPNDKYPEMYKKIARYLEDGVKQVWLIDPRKKVVFVHDTSSGEPVTLKPGSMLDGGSLLPGFSIAVAKIFE